jgi:co-chaperonin GroES (HSP10)
MAYTARIHIKADWKKITPTHSNILVTDMEFGERTTSGGVILPGDDKEERGIRPRWCRVLAVGHENKDVKAGEWIYVAHGRWTRGLDLTDEDGNTITVRMVDPKDVLLASKKLPVDDYVAPTYHLRD